MIPEGTIGTIILLLLCVISAFLGCTARDKT